MVARSALILSAMIAIVLSLDDNNISEWVSAQEDEEVNRRSPRNIEEVEWSYHSPYYTSEDEIKTIRKVKPRERRYDPEYYTENTEVHIPCKEVGTEREDGLTQIANAVSKISKMLFGASVIIMLPMLLGKMFIIPLKLFFILKVLFNMAMLWPLINRIITGANTGTTPTTVAKLAGSSDLETTRMLENTINTLINYANMSRNTRSVENYTDYPVENDVDGVFCDAKVLCYISKAFNAQNYKIKSAMMSAILTNGGLGSFVKNLKDKDSLEECPDSLCI